MIGTMDAHAIEGGFRVVCVLVGPDARQREASQARWVADDPFRDLSALGAVRYVRGLSIKNPVAPLQPQARLGAAHLWTRDAATAMKLTEYIRSGRLPLPDGVSALTYPVRERFIIGPLDDYGQTPLRAVFLVRRRGGTTLAEFENHWRTIHGPMVIGQAGVTRYVQLHRLPSSDGGPPDFDGSAELSFPDFDAYTAFSQCEPHHGRQVADLPLLFDLTGGVRMMTHEEEIFG